MTRLTLVLAAWISLLFPASASLAPRKEPLTLDKERLQLRSVTCLAAERAMGSDFVVTERTEVLLNGRPCKYEEVPADATIERMEVEADKQTVLKIHFRVRK